MKVAVTGGNGQIGRGVVALALRQGHEVVRLDIAPAPDDSAPFIHTDVTRYEEIEAGLEGCDALVHLAAIRSPVGRPDYEVHNTNVVASYNALSAAARLGIQRVAQASSVNATGAAYSRQPRYDYLPLDEEHPTYNEDPYSLSKWICEIQADSFARLYDQMRIASLRFHLIVPARADAASRWNDANPNPVFAKHLWGYTSLDAAARACLLGLTNSPLGHNVYYIIAPDTMMETPSLELHKQFYPDVPLRAEMAGHVGFYNCSRAEALLGWRHDPT